MACYQRLFGVSEQDDTERARRSRLGPLQRTLSKQLIAPNKPLRLVAKKSGRRTSFSSDGVDPTKRSASNHLATTRLVRAVQQKRDALASLRKQSIGTEDPRPTASGVSAPNLMMFACLQAPFPP